MVSSEKSPDEAEQSHDNGLSMSENQEPPPSSGAEKTLREPGTGVHISQLDKDGSISSITPRALQTPTAGSPPMQLGQEGKTPVWREKGFDDGYHWRKYGQKLIKGNEFVRSYYKCTHPSCLVKKQLERSHGGLIADIVYFGEHVHPKPLNNVPMAVGFVLSVEERSNEHKPIANKDKTANAGKKTSQVGSTDNPQVSTVTLSDNVKHLQAESNKIRDHVDNDEDQRSKRQKKSNGNVDPTPADKLTGEPSFVVQTMSEVDIVNDGYRWRKYGQKMVKGNLNPRSYYRCSSPGCPAKKHVERASHDQKLIITSYEGRHDHDMPPSRTVTHNATVTALNVEPGAKSGGSEAYDNSTPKSESKTEGTEKATHSRSGIENKPNEQQNGKSSTAEEKADAGTVNVAITSTVSNDRSSEKLNSAPKTESKANTGKANNVITSSASNGRSSEKQYSEIKIEPKDNDNPLGVQKITSPPNSNPNDHHIRKPEPVNS